MYICINTHVYFNNNNKKGAINLRVGVMGEGGGGVSGGAEGEVKLGENDVIVFQLFKQTFI